MHDDDSPFPDPRDPAFQTLAEAECQGCGHLPPEHAVGCPVADDPPVYVLRMDEVERVVEVETITYDDPPPSAA